MIKSPTKDQYIKTIKECFVELQETKDIKRMKVLEYHISTTFGLLCNEIEIDNIIAEIIEGN
jgi:hypothetical protein